MPTIATLRFTRNTSTTPLSACRPCRRPPRAASHQLPARAWVQGDLVGAVGRFAAAPGQTQEEEYEDLVEEGG
jgi:hypothetical protein